MLSETQRERYARHTVLEGIGEEGQERLLASKALVIGAGGLGSACLPYLAAAGVGTVGIADYDTVSLSNLQRQVLFTAADTGRNKAQAASERLTAINPDIQTHVIKDRITPDSIMSVISGYDFVIDATDRIGTKFLINDACVLAGKPYSHAGVMRYGGQTMTYISGKGPCLRCLIRDVPEGAETCAKIGVLGPCAGVIGSIQAAECIKYLAGSEDLLTGKVFTFDAARLISRVTDFPEDPSCPVCSSHAVITSLDTRKGEYYL